MFEKKKRNQLKGHIPPEIGNIEGLLVLAVLANNLSGVIPHSVQFVIAEGVESGRKYVIWNYSF